MIMLASLEDVSNIENFDTSDQPKINGIEQATNLIDFENQTKEDVVNNGNELNETDESNIVETR